MHAPYRRHDGRDDLPCEPHGPDNVAGEGDEVDAVLRRPPLRRRVRRQAAEGLKG